MRPDDHPLRQWAVDEMHLRRFAPVSSHCDIYQAVRLIEAQDRDQEDRMLIGDKPAFDEWRLASRDATGHHASGIHFLWERHTEASTLTLIFPDDCPDDVRAPYIAWIERWVGSVVRATRVFVIPDEGEINTFSAAKGMDFNDQVCSDVNGGIRIWSDFSLGEDGYGRLIVSAGDVSDSERGRIVQRLQELGNYRNMALLGLSTVQHYGPQADKLEEELSDHASRVARMRDSEQDDSLLQELIEISSRLEVIRCGRRPAASARCPVRSQPPEPDGIHRTTLGPGGADMFGVHRPAGPHRGTDITGDAHAGRARRYPDQGAEFDPDETYGTLDPAAIPVAKPDRGTVGHCGCLLPDRTDKIPGRWRHCMAVRLYHGHCDRGGDEGR